MYVDAAVHVVIRHIPLLLCVDIFLSWHPRNPLGGCRKAHLHISTPFTPLHVPSNPRLHALMPADWTERLPFAVADQVHGDAPHGPQRAARLLLHCLDCFTDAQMQLSVVPVYCWLLSTPATAWISLCDGLLLIFHSQVHSVSSTEAEG